MSHLTSRTATKSFLYLTNSQAAVVTAPDLYRLLLCTKCHVSFPLLRSYQRINPGPMHMYPFRNKTSFYGEELLAPLLTPKLADHPLSSVYIFNIFAATLHIGGRSSIRNLTTRHAVVTGTGLSWIILFILPAPYFIHNS